MSTAFWNGHGCFGDSFCLCAAAHIFAKKTNTTVQVSYWEPFKNLANYFDGIEYVPENQCEKVDTGAELEFVKHNGVTRFYEWMLRHSKIESQYNEVNIEMNIKPFDCRPFISLAVYGNKNGPMSKDVMAKMLIRAKAFYPNHQFRIIGHFQSDVELYANLMKDYQIKDERPTDRTCDVVMNQIRSSSLVLGVHTGLLYPSLGLGIPVWCERSKNPNHDFCLDFPSNRPFFFEP